jgi:hypothetical protein
MTSRSKTVRLTMCLMLAVATLSSASLSPARADEHGREGWQEHGRDRWREHDRYNHYRYRPDVYDSAPPSS